MEYLEKGTQVWIVLDNGDETTVEEATVDMDFMDGTRVISKGTEGTFFTFTVDHGFVFMTEKEACEMAVQELTDWETELEASLDSTRKELASMKIRLKDLEFSEKE